MRKYAVLGSRGIGGGDADPHRMYCMLRVNWSVAFFPLWPQRTRMRSTCTHLLERTRGWYGAGGGGGQEEGGGPFSVACRLAHACLWHRLRLHRQIRRLQQVACCMLSAAPTDSAWRRRPRRQRRTRPSQRLRRCDCACAQKYSRVR